MTSLRWWLVMAVAVHLATPVHGQLVDEAKRQALLASIPELTERGLREKIEQSILYTDEEMPPAYQFQPLAGGVGVDGTVFYTPSAHLNRIRFETNGNREFPWKTPGGLDFATGTAHFRFLWLPRKSNGQLWPVAVYRAPLEKSNAVNMPVPTGWRWLYPAGTTIGEVLAMRFSDGYMYTYEIRTRTREIDDWDVEVYRPFPTLDDLQKRLRDLNRFDLEYAVAQVQPQMHRLADSIHPVSAFDRHGMMFSLPPMPLDVVKRLLLETPFKPSAGLHFTRDCYAPTTEYAEQIVPAKYLGTFMGTSRESCINCHKHVLKHVDRFANAEWYGYIRGSDGIFSFHPVEPASIGPPDKPVRLRQALVNIGAVEVYEDAKHPNDTYATIETIENRPAARYPNTGRVVVGGR